MPVHRRGWSQPRDGTLPSTEEIAGPVHTAVGAQGGGVISSPGTADHPAAEHARRPRRLFPTGEKKSAGAQDGFSGSSPATSNAGRSEVATQTTGSAGAQSFRSHAHNRVPAGGGGLLRSASFASTRASTRRPPARTTAPPSQHRHVDGHIPGVGFVASRRPLFVDRWRSLAAPRPSSHRSMWSSSLPAASRGVLDHATPLLRPSPIPPLSASLARRHLRSLAMGDLRQAPPTPVTPRARNVGATFRPAASTFIRDASSRSGAVGTTGAGGGRVCWGTIPALTCPSPQSDRQHHAALPRHQRGRTDQWRGAAPLRAKWSCY